MSSSFQDTEDAQWAKALELGVSLKLELFFMCGKRLIGRVGNDVLIVMATTQPESVVEWCLLLHCSCHHR